MQAERSVERLTFQLKDKLTVILDDKVKQSFQEVQQSKKFQLESGGIMIGILVRGRTIQITDITKPQEDDVCQKFRFFRKRKGHQTAMDSIWKSSGYRKLYLGEWHTHDEPYPIPSWIDSSGWRRIARSKNNSPWMLFVIIGTVHIRMWTVDEGKIEELIIDEDQAI